VRRWVLIAAAGAVGLLAGRLSKRDAEYDD
jgi:hypothetical protein